MNDITTRRPIKWTSFADTSVGTVRKVNEDSILLKPEIGLWAVADGMGGYEAGDVASNMIIEALNDTEYKAAFNDIIDTVEDSLIDTNNKILEYADIMLDQQTMGSTVVSLIIRGRVGACLWAGDSRLYRYRNGELQQMSQDHSQVEELIQQGFLTEEDAENHPDSNVITRAIGASEEIYIDINVFSTQIGDTFLLCSDGLHNSVNVSDIINCLNEQNIEQSVNNLLAKALENNASDNVSVIIARGVADKVVSNKIFLSD